MHSVFTATLFIIAMVSKQPESMERSMDKEDLMCTCTRACGCVYEEEKREEGKREGGKRGRRKRRGVLTAACIQKEHAPVMSLG